jgi:hypothetical protein
VRTASSWRRFDARAISSVEAFGAGDEQQHRHSAGDHEQRRPDGHHSLFGQRHEPYAEAAVAGWMFSGHARRKASSSADALRRRRAIGEPREDGVVVAGVVRALLAAHLRRQPQLVVAGKRPRKRGRARHDADDRARRAVDLDGAPRIEKSAP